MQIHSNELRERWRQMSLVEQLGNAGSEVDRALTLMTRGIESDAQRAVDRFIELMNFTLEDSRWRGSRRREIGRGREEWCRVWYGERDQQELRALQAYFLQFGIAARKT